MTKPMDKAQVRAFTLEAGLQVSDSCHARGCRGTDLLHLERLDMRIAVFCGHTGSRGYKRGHYKPRATDVGHWTSAVKSSKAGYSVEVI